MKILIIFTLYVLYNVYFSNNNNTYGGLLAKPVNKMVTKKQFYRSVLRKR